MTPDQCALCNAAGNVVAAGFRQLLPQAGGAPQPCDWWECRKCGAWFVHPIPSPEAIARYWKTVSWTDENSSDRLATRKDHLFERIVTQLGPPTPPGGLLDVGCNFGRFLERVRAAGWRGYGFDPNEEAAGITRSRGFDVVAGWDLAQAGYREGEFQAITLLDVFCYSWQPFRDLETIRRLLAPGGVLVMRLSNKQSLLRCIRALTPGGATRDRRLSSVLRGHFHSIALDALERILLDNGFSEVVIDPGATTASLSEMGWKGKIGYLLPALVSRLSFGRLNLSPGVLLRARKAISAADPSPTKLNANGE